MKILHVLLIAALSLAAGGSAYAFDPVKGLSKTEVVFFEPEKFTDVRDSSFGASENRRDATLGELRAHIVKQATRLLGPGQQLKITVTDVDLAGDFEPWHGAQWDEVRIVKDIYPPRIKLAFQLTDADGEILKKGDRDLTDMSFMSNLSIDRQDPLRHEKTLLEDWLRREFRGLKGK